MPLRSCFELDAIDDIEPWGEGENRSLHWFGLTSGRYWVSTPVGEALRCTDQKASYWNLPSPYADYYVSRFFEDLQDVLPIALTPVPPDIAATVAGGDWFTRAERWIEESEEGDGRWMRCYEAMEWYHNRSLDSGHLVNGPLFHFLRVGDEVTILWEPTGESSDGVWLTPRGQFTVSAEELKSAAYAFFSEVLAAMQDRIDSIQARGWHRADCELDIALLIEDQRRRTALLEALKERRDETNWANVRSLIEPLSVEF